MSAPENQKSPSNGKTGPGDSIAELRSLADSMTDETDIGQLFRGMDATNLVFDGVETQLDHLLGSLDKLMDDLESQLPTAPSDSPDGSKPTETEDLSDTLNGVRQPGPSKASPGDKKRTEP